MLPNLFAMFVLMMLAWTIGPAQKFVFLLLCALAGWYLKDAIQHFKHGKFWTI